MSLAPIRHTVATLPAVVHGSVSAVELAGFGLRLEDVLDFSVNTNPLGPAPSVLRAISEADWARYPGDDEAALRAALAARDGVERDWVALGNGSVELIWNVALASLEPGAAAHVLGPTFGEYARAIQIAGGRLDGSGRPRLTFVCNPNNPSGHYQTRTAILELAASTDLLVVDEAYATFADERWDTRPVLERGNVVVLRSMTKDHALPGLRLGYALAAPPLVRALDAVRPPWSVNAGALRAGLAALQPAAVAHVEQARQLVRAARELLTAGLRERGYRVLPSQANFVLVEVGDGAAFRQRLIARGLVVRDCASFGLPHCVRIACRLPGECQRLLDHIDAR